jgi:hypothetical protein
MSESEHGLPLDRAEWRADGAEEAGAVHMARGTESGSGVVAMTMSLEGDAPAEVASARGSLLQLAQADRCARVLATLDGRRNLRPYDY